MHDGHEVRLELSEAHFVSIVCQNTNNITNTKYKIRFQCLDIPNIQNCKVKSGLVIFHGDKPASRDHRGALRVHSVSTYQKYKEYKVQIKCWCSDIPNI